MKKIFLSILLILGFINISLSAPNNSMTLQYGPSPNDVVNSSSYKTEENHQITTYNAHSHTDLTQVGTITSGTWQGTAVATGYGGTGATAAANAANGVVILDASGYAPNNSVDTTALKTTTGEITDSAATENRVIAIVNDVSSIGTTYVTNVSISTAGNYTLPGGTYGFYPQCKYTGGAYYVQQRYVTASGNDLWIFLLLDKTTKEILGAYSAPDAPHYGNSGDYNKVPHPFGSYNSDTQEIILVDKETANLIKSQATEERSILTIVNEDMKVDYATEKVYEPLHSGKFLTKDGKQVKEMVTEIASYIKVKRLSKLTDIEKQQKEIKKQQDKQKAEQDEQKKIQDKLSAENKLKELGLTKDELDAILN